MKNCSYPGKIPSVWAGKNAKKRGLRILPNHGGYAVHVTSRAIHQQFLFNAPEKDKFTELMEAWACFSGITVITHCTMSNHFHLFLWVPKPEAVAIEELRRRIRKVWPPNKVAQWERFYEGSTPEQQKELEQALTERMCDLPAFMRVLKQTFSSWYNKTHDVSGTLWESRYRSMVVQDTREGYMNVSTYIDLNPIRAAICEDPEAYNWSGYARAAAGDPLRQRGLELLLEKAGIACATGAHEVYRVWLYEKGKSLADSVGVSEKRRKRKGFSSFEVLREYEKVMTIQT